MEIIKNGVCAAKGFRAGAVHCGIKNGSTKNDLAVIVSDVPCNAAAVYTTNAVKAAPIYVTMKHLENGKATAVVVNSGNANACAPYGTENAIKMCQFGARELGVEPSDIIVSSTGVIGQTINIDAIDKGITKIPDALSYEGSDAAATAIMTTDLTEKQIAVSVEIGGKTVNVGAIAKGSGMIHPNMGTMLCFVTTDCAISSEMLDKMLKDVTRRTFNRVSVDGDTSTNDMCTVLANGLAENAEITAENADYEVFKGALTHVLTYLSRAIAQDGEGATKLMTCIVENADKEDTAEQIAKSVIASSLVKTAMFGCDANWGRVLCSMGYSGAGFNPQAVDISFRSENGIVAVCKNGEGLNFDEDLAEKVLTTKEIEILIDLHAGNESAHAWGCDLSYDYVKINGDYRT